MSAETSKILVEGMTCQNCVRHVREAIEKTEGVETADVDLTTGEAKIRWTNSPHLDLVLDHIYQAGYDAKPADQTPLPARSPLSPLQGWTFNVIFGGGIMLTLMLFEWGLHAGMERWYQWMSFALALPVQILCGARFYKGAWNQLKIGHSNMDTLVSLGSTAAFLYSTAGLLLGWPGHLYFMEAVAILSLISIGHWMESVAGEKAASAVRALLQLTPPYAHLLLPDGTEKKVAVSELDRSHKIVIRPGDRIPTDGKVLEGTSVVDESMLTGESLPAEKSAGSSLFAGTINQSGRLISQVTALGEETALARIVEAVKRAQNSRANIQRLADRISSVFVPLVILIAIATFIGWTTFGSAGPGQSLIYAVGVLIVACPCAMGLATPAAIMAGTNVASRFGILIRDGHALEKTGTLTSIVFDKTGTLTRGKLSVAAHRFLDSTNPQLDSLIHALANPSAHPISKAIAASFNPGTSDPRLENWKEVPGKGVHGEWEGKAYFLGSLSETAEQGASLKESDSFIREWTSQASTVIALSSGRKLLGVIALRDEVKNGSVEVVRNLKQSNLKVYLVTGDMQETAVAIAGKVGISPQNVHAAIRPEGKAEFIRQLQQQGERVAFIGDGINDAPALAQANLGIAVAQASDIAKEAADILLLNADVESIPHALDISRKTLLTIKQNLFWAFFYNAAAIPLAAFGFISPILCAAAMALSDLFVIGNSIRLQWRFKVAPKAGNVVSD